MVPFGSSLQRREADDNGPFTDALSLKMLSRTAPDEVFTAEFFDNWGNGGDIILIGLWIGHVYLSDYGLNSILCQ